MTTLDDDLFAADMTHLYTLANLLYWHATPAHLQAIHDHWPTAETPTRRQRWRATTRRILWGTQP